jgi:deazaflavin-dependent oxidoreductase (nitroreductase family)
MIDSLAKRQTAREKRKAHGIGRRFSQWPVWVYRLQLGWLLGHRFLLVSHRGCRSGLVRQTGVMVLRYDSHSQLAYVVAGSQSADWYRNVRASPAVEIAIGRERYRPEQKFLQPQEIAMLLKWSRRHHPLTARVQSLFFGWPWQASEAELLNLAQSLGGIAFRPVQTNVKVE